MAENISLVIEVDDRGTANVRRFSDQVSRLGSDAGVKTSKAFRDLSTSTNRFSSVATASGRSVADLTTKHSLMQRAMSGVHDTITRVSGSLPSLSAIISATAKGVGLLTAGAGALGAGLFALTKSTADYQARLQEISRTVGVTTESLSALRFAAEQEGVSFETLTTSLTAAQRRISEAAQGNKAFADSFTALGVSVRDSTGNVQSIEQLLPTIADRLSKMTDETKRTQLAFDIFGRSGVALLPVLDKGAKGLQEYTARAKELGIIVSKDAADSSKQFTGAMTDLSKAVTGLRNSIGNQLIPVFTPLIMKITDIITNLRSAGDESGLFARVTVQSLKFVAQGISTVVGGVAQIAEGWLRLDQAASTVTDNLLAGYQLIIKGQRAVGLISADTASKLLLDLDKIRLKFLEDATAAGGLADSLKAFRTDSSKAFDVLLQKVGEANSSIRKLGDTTQQTAQKATAATEAVAKGWIKAGDIILTLPSATQKVDSVTQQATDNMQRGWIKVGDEVFNLQERIVATVPAVQQLGDAAQNTFTTVQESAKKTADAVKQTTDAVKTQVDTVVSTETKSISTLQSSLGSLGLFGNTTGFGKVGDFQSFAGDQEGLLRQLKEQADIIPSLPHRNITGTIGYREYLRDQSIKAQSEIAARLLQEGLTPAQILPNLIIPSGYESNFTAFNLPNRANPFGGSPGGGTSGFPGATIRTGDINVNVTGIDPKNLDARGIASALAPTLREMIRRGELAI